MTEIKKTPNTIELDDAYYARDVKTAAEVMSKMSDDELYDPNNINTLMHLQTQVYMNKLKWRYTPWFMRISHFLKKVVESEVYDDRINYDNYYFNVAWRDKWNIRKALMEERIEIVTAIINFRTDEPQDTLNAESLVEFPIEFNPDKHSEYHYKRFVEARDMTIKAFFR